MATHRTRPRSLTETMFTRAELEQSVKGARETEAILIANFLRHRAGEMAGKADYHPQFTFNSLADSIERQEYRS